MERHDELAILRAEVAALRREMRRTWRGRGWWRMPLALFCVAALAVTPLGVLGANFQDLNAGSAHNADINLIADAGISVGCTDIQHYCPSSFVSREQMASFLARTAGLGNNPPVTNAAMLEGWGADALMRSAVAYNNDLIELSDQPTTVVSVTIEVPAPGYVLLSATLDCWPDGGEHGVDVRLVDPAAGLRGPFSGAHLGAVPGGTLQATVALVARFPVAAAGARTFELRAKSQLFAGSGEAVADEATITALYVPFGADGSQGPGVGSPPGIFPINVTGPTLSPRTR